MPQLISQERGSQRQTILQPVERALSNLSYAAILAAFEFRRALLRFIRADHPLQLAVVGHGSGAVGRNAFHHRGVCSAGLRGAANTAGTASILERWLICPPARRRAWRMGKHQDDRRVEEQGAATVPLDRSRIPSLEHVFGDCTSPARVLERRVNIHGNCSHTQFLPEQ